MDENICMGETDNVFSIRKSNCLFGQMIIAEFTVVFYAILNLLLNIIMFENRRSSDDPTTESFKITLMETIGFITTILMVGSMYIRYDLWLQWSKSINKFS